MYSLSAHRISKSFDGQEFVLRELTFSLTEGDILGLLGPNGAGKTTAVRILNGVVEPSTGEISVCGMHYPQDLKAIHSMTGVMTEHAALYESMSGIDNLHFFARMHDVDRGSEDSTISDLLAYFDLDRYRHKLVKTYSSGMKKKLSLAVALLHRPRVLFLDEPTASLDPEAALDVLHLIQQLNHEQGITVVLCSHQLKYLEDVCTHYGFLKEGKLIALGSFDALLRGAKLGDRLLVRMKNAPPDGMLRKGQGSWMAQVADDEEAASLITRLVEAGCQVMEARRDRPDLEELYFHLQGRSS